MEYWHGSEETPRLPANPSAREGVGVVAGTWPIQADQYLWLEYHVRHKDGSEESGRADFVWERNEAQNSYWRAEIGPFEDADEVEYSISGDAPDGVGKQRGPFSFRVAPKIHLALLWHQHQPLYKNLARKNQHGSYRFPWVRLHGLRDYYGMAALLAEFPEVHATINLTPVLLWQIEDYTERGATDRALDLTLRPPSRLAAAQREELLASFFDAGWHTQIYPWPRYAELFSMRGKRESFKTQDIRDLQMWFNLAWFAPEFQEDEVELPDGSTASVQRWIKKGAGYSTADIDEMVEEQFKVLRNIVAIHRKLQDQGQIEVATTPFFHPILPLIDDSSSGTLDREGAVLPTPFVRPEDAAAQVEQAVAFYADRFGHPPRGMWPAEGAVGPSVIRHFASAGVAWIASDRGVLEKSGRYGYETKDPNVLCRAYRIEDEEGRAVAIFFRDTALSDRIGFQYQHYPSAEKAANEFVLELKERFAWQVDDPSNRVVCVALDGENAWGSYPEHGRPFLRALYRALAEDSEIQTVTFAEYLEGNAKRRVLAHPVRGLARIHGLSTGSWIDEMGSERGVDLGTWIGEVEENRGWDLLRAAAADFDAMGVTPDTHPDAYQALMAPEGSDWFWWFGEDQSCDSDAELDDLFRGHLKAAYKAIGRRPPRALSRHIVPHIPVWTFAQQIRTIQSGDQISIRTNCPGQIEWETQARKGSTRDLFEAGGVMAGQQRYSTTLGPFSASDERVTFRFQCRNADCDRRADCCQADLHGITVEP